MNTNEIVNNKWQQYLTDLEQPKTDLRIFVSTFVISVDKTVVDAGVVANRIRSIPNITTVSKQTIGTEKGHMFKAFYYIKFVLEPYEDLNTYIVKVLKKQLHELVGIRIHSYRGTEEINTDQNE